MSMEEVFDARLGNDDALLPDGWESMNNIFAADHGFGEVLDSDGSFGTELTLGGNETGNEPETDALTMGEESEDGANQDNETEAEAQQSDGTPAAQTPSRKLKLTVNHASEEVDINAMSDEELTALLQMGKAYKESQSKASYRKAYEKQMEAGMTEEVADAVATRIAGKSFASDYAESADDVDTEVVSNATQTPAAEAHKDERGSNSLVDEIRQLKVLYPDFAGLPDEVIIANSKGVPISTAYVAYRSKQAAATAKENKVLKQNAASAAKAPIRGIAGGGNATAPKKNPVLDAFDMPQW